MGAAVFGENAPKANALAIEPSHGPQQKVHFLRLLFIRQHLDISQSRGVVDGPMNFVHNPRHGRTLATISGNPVTDVLKAGELFGIEVDHGAWPCPQVATVRLGGLGS